MSRRCSPIPDTGPESTILGDVIVRAVDGLVWIATPAGMFKASPEAAMALAAALFHHATEANRPAVEHSALVWEGGRETMAEAREVEALPDVGQPALRGEEVGR